MGLRRIIWIWTGSLVAIPTAALADEPINLERIGNWTLEDNAESCRLIGAFGEGDDRIIARFTRYEPTDWFELKLYGEAIRADGPYDYLTVDFGPMGSPQPEWATFGMAGKIPFANLGMQRFDLYRLLSSTDPGPALNPDFEASVRTLTLGPLSGKSYRLQLGPMQVNMAAMRRCTDDLIRSWGLDPAEQMTLQKQAEPLSSPATWIRSSDFPSGPLSDGKNAITRFRLDLDEHGKVLGCHIQSSTSPEDFAAATCKIISQRASFSPALNRQGRAVRSYYAKTVRWVAGIEYSPSTP